MSFLEWWVIGCISTALLAGALGWYLDYLSVRGKRK